MTTLRVGSASDVGQLRANNQDSKLVADDVAVYAVADGMGGHQGGEVASAIAVETLEAIITEPTTASVVEAVKEANRRIFSRAADTTELRGMGTTLVAIALVDRNGQDEEIAWVNVGDSRAYLLRDGELVQLSRDHSLVEDLRRGGQLSEEEAAVHPQRNILTRALGIDAEVEVDSDAVIPLQGDRFLLCSDGLFNEVDKPTLVATLSSIDDPEAAAHELVRLANAGGGRDNITCVIVDVIDDDGRSARAAAGGGAGAAAAADPDATVISDPPAAPPPAGDDLDEGPPTAEMPAVATDVLGDSDPTPPAGTPLPPPPAAPVAPNPDPVPAAAAPAAATRPGFPVADEEAEPVAPGDLPFGRQTTDVYGDMDKVGGRPRIVGVVVVALLVVVALAGLYFAGSWYAGRDYFVAAEGEEIRIYQGTPGGFLVFDPELIEVSDLALGDAGSKERADIEAERTFDSLADARSFVNTAETRAEAAERAATTTTTTTTEPPTTTTKPPPTTTRPGASTTTAPTTG